MSRDGRANRHARQVENLTATIIFSIMAALGTAVGGALVWAIRRPTDRLLDSAMGFAAGVMLAATCFGLIPAALERASLGVVIVCVLLGAFALATADRLLPHMHPRFADTDGYQAGGHARPSPLGRAWLVAGALTLHNAPEGAAVGAAFAAGGLQLGVPLAAAITFHNIPEGFAVVAPLIGKMGRGRIFLGAAATGLIEVPAALIAFFAVAHVAPLLPITLALAAGAMLYVACDELLTDALSHGHERAVTLWLIVGLCMLLGLQTLAAQFAS